MSYTHMSLFLNVRQENEKKFLQVTLGTHEKIETCALPHTHTCHYF